MGVQFTLHIPDRVEHDAAQLGVYSVAVGGDRNGDARLRHAGTVSKWGEKPW